MNTTRTTPTPSSDTLCAFWAGCATNDPAVHEVEGINLCAYHSPFDADPDAMTLWLAGFDARYPSSPAPIEITEELIADTLPAPIEASTFAPWFTLLLDRDEVCTDRDAFERASYKGHLAYSLSMTDGYFAPESFDDWVIGFRKDPIGQLYWGNDARHALAPQVNSYIAIIASTTFLPPTPSYPTLPPQSKARPGGKNSKGNQAQRGRANYKR